MKAGDTFYNRNPTSPERLWLVACDPDENGDVVIFFVEPSHSLSDDACIIPLGHHPRISRDSAVNYEMGRKLTLERQRGLVRLGFYDPQEPLTLGLLNRVQDGALNSEFTPPPLQTMITRSLVSN